MNLEVELFDMLDNIDLYKSKVNEAKKIFYILTEFILNNNELIKKSVLTSYELNKNLTLEKRLSFCFGITFSSLFKIVTDLDEELENQINFFNITYKKLPTIFNKKFIELGIYTNIHSYFETKKI